MLSNDRALPVEVADVADVKVRNPDIRVDNDVDDVYHSASLHGAEPFLV